MIVRTEEPAEVCAAEPDRLSDRPDLARLRMELRRVGRNGFAVNRERSKRGVPGEAAAHAVERDLATGPDAHARLSAVARRRLVLLVALAPVSMVLTDVPVTERGRKPRAGATSQQLLFVGFGQSRGVAW
ncbi:hypothetical protein ACFY9A_19180 [Streptomyces rubradiris]|uniref:hypothetical protein n=1 Tax=Streptomyces rubradiris TaxID=285531 RepID=UPI0036E3ED4A